MAGKTSRLWCASASGWSSGRPRRPVLAALAILPRDEIASDPFSGLHRCDQVRDNELSHFHARSRRRDALPPTPTIRPVEDRTPPALREVSARMKLVILIPRL